MKAPRDPQELLFRVKQLSGGFAFPNIIFKLVQKQQKRHYRVTMSQFSHLYLTSSHFGERNKGTIAFFKFIYDFSIL